MRYKYPCSLGSMLILMYITNRDIIVDVMKDLQQFRQMHE